jgi:hypothetical protein
MIYIPEVRFSFERGNEGDTEFVKISKGEESCFIWSVFFSLMEQVVSVLNITEEQKIVKLTNLIIWNIFLLMTQLAP